MVKKVLLFSIIGILVASILFLVTFTFSETFGLGWIFATYDPMSTIITVICTGLILQKLDEIKKE